MAMSLHELSPFVHLCGEFRIQPGFSRPFWLISSHHFLHVFRGEGYYQVGERTFRLVPGDLLLIPPGTLTRSWNPFAVVMQYHSLHVDFRYHGDYETLPVTFPEDCPGNRARVHAAPDTSPALRLPLKTNVAGQGWVGELFARIVRETAEKQPGYELATKAALLELLLFLHRGTVAEKGEPPVEAIQRAVRFLEANVARPLELRDIAGTVHLSPVYFGRLFRTATGLTPMAYLRGLRMDRARRLLREEELSVAQVADAVGFPDPYHFSRVFRQHEGMPPSRYRELARDPAWPGLPTAEAWRGGYDSFAGVSFFSIPPREES